MPHPILFRSMRSLSILASLALASSPSAFAAPRAKKEVGKKPAAEMLFVSPTGWTAVNTDRQEQVALTEWVQADQTRENNSEMITLLAFASAVNIPPKDFAANLVERFKGMGCTAEVYAPPVDEAQKGFALQSKRKAPATEESMATYACATAAKSGMSRAMMAKGLLYVIQYEKKKPTLSAEDLKSMSSTLAETTRVIEPKDAKSYEQTAKKQFKKTRTVYRLHF